MCLLIPTFSPAIMSKALTLVTKQPSSSKTGVTSHLPERFWIISLSIRSAFSGVTPDGKKSSSLMSFGFVSPSAAQTPNLGLVPFSHLDVPQFPLVLNFWLRSHWLSFPLRKASHVLFFLVLDRFALLLFNQRSNVALLFFRLLLEALVFRLLFRPGSGINLWLLLLRLFLLCCFGADLFLLTPEPGGETSSKASWYPPLKPQHP